MLAPTLVIVLCLHLPYACTTQLQPDFKEAGSKWSLRPEFPPSSSQIKSELGAVVGGGGTAAGGASGVSSGTAAAAGNKKGPTRCALVRGN